MITNVVPLLYFMGAVLAVVGVWYLIARRNLEDA